MDVDMEEQVARCNLFAKVYKEMKGGAGDMMWRYDWGVVHTWCGAKLEVEHAWWKCGCDDGVHDALHIPML